MVDANTKTTRRVKSCAFEQTSKGGATLEIVWLYSGPIPHGLNDDRTIRWRMWEDEQRQVMRDVPEDAVADFCRVWGVVR